MTFSGPTPSAADGAFAIELLDVSKRYGDFVALQGVDLDIAPGEFLVLLGPSGCGKSTLLKLIAGLEDASGGEIYIDGRLANYLRPKDRDVAMVFQNYALYPHMTVETNIGFPLAMRRAPKSTVARRVREVAALVGLTDHLTKYPDQLSGGQRQRVAMGRAIVRHPKAFLLDEPLSNLDAKLRVQLRAELGNLHNRLGVTTIHVTHDQVEAMTLGSRVAVFSKGALQQYASPADLYHRPANIFVAGFIGSPAMNFLDAVVVGGGATIDIAVGDLRIGLPASASRTKLAAGQHVIVGVRPEHLDWRPAGAGDAGLAARVRLLEQLEPESYVSVEPIGLSAAIRLSDEFVGRGAADPVEQVGIGERTMIVRTPASRLPALGAEISIVIDPARVALFDAASGAAL